MTEAEEQKKIDFEVYKFKQRIAKLNAENKIIKITGFRLQINHPTPVTLTPVNPWDRFFKLFKRKSSK